MDNVIGKLLNWFEIGRGMVLGRFTNIISLALVFATYVTVQGYDFGKLKAGQAILFDEVVTDEGAQSRNFMSKTNKFMESVIATYLLF